ncbi:MAG TPA: SDR family oxidoreductase [Candidatus Acidoferrales bacterium]|nr:SDR family oxidoreductase [Candidatus Acidoferrales bacterium]
MTSPHWDEARAAAYREFRFEFPEKTLARRTVVVAGGTGGLGSATVALLAGEGVNLVVGYHRDQGRAQRLSDAIEREFGRKLTLVEGDLCDATVRRSYLEAADRLGKPLSGAAIFSGDPARVAFQDLDRESVVTSLESNYVGPVLLAKDLGDAMAVAKTGGSLVLLATMQAVAAFPSSLNYAAPKAALVHAARILAQQWNSVRVNVIAPGATMAGMAAASIQSGKYDRYIDGGAIPRFGRPEDVARAVRFFLEPDNYITGQTLLVDGGLTLRRDR